MSHIVDIFLQPGRVFADQKERPTFLVPLLIVSAFAAAFTLAYFLSVDPVWYLDHAIAAGGQEMSAAEMEQARKFMPGAKVMGYIGAASTVVVMGIVMLLYALYFLVAGKITGNAVGFKHGLSLAAWSSMPMILGSIVALIGVFTMTPQTPVESLALLNFDPLLVELPADSRWSTLAKSFSLLTFWSVFLTALGWKTWGRTSWLQGIVIALLPNVLIYGAMALYALSK